MTRRQYRQRCDRKSFVGNFQCDREATSNGRCAAHNLPAHADAVGWVEFLRARRPPSLHRHPAHSRRE